MSPNSSKPDDLLLVYCPFPSQEKALEISKSLLEKNVIVCANCFPSGTSVFIWEGKVCEDTEAIAILKCLRKNISSLEALLTEHHPYDVPAIISLECAKVSGPFLKWAQQTPS